SQTSYLIESRQYYSAGTQIFSGTLETDAFYAPAGTEIEYRLAVNNASSASYTYNNTSSFSLHEVPTPIGVIGPANTNKYQTKYLPSDISSSTNPITSLGFNNLTIGKRYRVTASVALNTASSGNGSFVATNNSNAVLRLRKQMTAAGTSILTGQGLVFTATATTIVCAFGVGGTSAILEGDGSADETWVMLEECNESIPTSDWA
ncbi:MAG: hypothetical protein RBT63_00410, partial [Bdellovibrionales bacterium]|nr:hypothetical protein [Bdellovibrionales bacterium]